jgi:hypothetical protein
MPDGFDAAELAEIVEAASKSFEPEGDSEEEQPEDGEDEDEEPDDDEEAEDDDAEADEDPDESDEEDDDQDSPDDEDESDEDESEDEDEESEPLALEDDVAVRLPDGTELTGRELREGYLRQQDYTQKTQKVSDAYKKMESWYNQRVQNPNGWIAEIAYSQDDPGSAIAGAFRETGNATVLFGQVVRHLVEQGDLADEVVEALNLTKLAEQARGESVHLELQNLKQQLQSRDAKHAEQAQLAQIEARLNQQWASIVTSNALEFGSPDAEFSEKVKLLEFARDRQIIDLQDAWLLKTALDGGSTQKPTAKAAPKKKAQAEAAVKKRKTAVMSRKPAGGGGPKPSKKAGGNPMEEAAAAALDELGLGDD